MICLHETLPVKSYLYVPYRIYLDATDHKVFSVHDWPGFTFSEEYHQWESCKDSNGVDVFKMGCEINKLWQVFEGSGEIK